MFGTLATRDRDFHARKPYRENRRYGGRRRRAKSMLPRSNRREIQERRLDCDWRYAVIRRLMTPAFCSAWH